MVTKEMTVAVNNKQGFFFKGKRIYFIDRHGMDISFNGWRVVLYYQPGFALTHFLESQAEYDSFIRQHQPYCYDDYGLFRKESIERS